MAGFLFAVFLPHLFGTKSQSNFLNVRSGSEADPHTRIIWTSAYGGKADVKNRQNPPMLTSALCRYCWKTRKFRDAKLLLSVIIIKS